MVDVRPHAVRRTLRDSSSAARAGPPPGRRASPEVRKTVTVVFSRRDGIDRARRAARPRSLRRVMGRYFDEMQSVVEATRARREVHRRRRDGRFRDPGRARGRRDARCARRGRDARAARGAERRSSNATGASGSPFGPVSTPARSSRATRAAASASRPATRSTSRSASKRLRRSGRDPARRAHVPPRPRRRRGRGVEPLELKGKASRSAPTACSAWKRALRAARGASIRRWSVVSGSSPHWTRRTTRGRRGRLPPVHRSRRGGCRQVTAGRRVPRGLGDAPRSCEGVVSRTEKASRTGRCSRSLPDSTATIRWRRSQASPETRSELIAERIAAASASARAPGPSDETAWAVRSLFEAQAKEQPLVVLFDDLQWAEPTLLDLVEHIADWARDAPILLVCLARPDLLDEPAGLERRASSTQRPCCSSA